MKFRVIGLSVSLALATACHDEPPPAIVTPVKVETAALLSGVAGLSYSAQVMPETQVDVAFRTDGYIDSIKQVPGVESSMRILQPGDVVASGDELARVKDEQYRDQVTKAQANLEKARAAAHKGEQDFRRAEALQATQSITGPDYDAAQKEYETANAAVVAALAQLDEAELKLSETALVSPLAGIVQQRNIEVGTLVHSGSVGFVVANTSRVKVVFGVPDAMLGNIELGSELAIHTESLPDRTFVGEVTEIAPAADQRTRIFEITVTVDNSEDALKPGMVAALDVGADMAGTGALVVVPVSAVVAEGESGFAVYTVDEGSDGASTASLRTVATGPILGNRIVITDGLEEGARVIVTGTGQVSNGKPVKVLP